MVILLIRVLIWIGTTAIYTSALFCIVRMNLLAFQRHRHRYRNRCSKCKGSIRYRYERLPSYRVDRCK